MMFYSGFLYFKKRSKWYECILNMTLFILADVVLKEQKVSNQNTLTIIIFILRLWNRFLK